MQNKWIGALLLGSAIMLSHTAYAEGPGHGGPDSHREELKSMSPEERATFHAERKAKWEALSDAEKVKMIEQRRDEKQKEMEARWNAMSDAEKIKHVEQRMQQKGGGKPHGGDREMMMRERGGDREAMREKMRERMQERGGDRPMRRPSAERDAAE